MSTVDDVEIPLEPIDPSTLRAANGTAVWETVRGRRNRVTIGSHRWRPVDADAPVRSRLAVDHQLELAELELSLTLLPDIDCRFRSADLVMSLTAPGAEFVELRPQSIASSSERTTARPQAGVGINVFGLGEAKLTSPAASVRYTEVESTLEAFGLNSGEAGWRLRAVRGQEIPLSMPGLVATVAFRREATGSVVLNVVAEIDIRTAADRWLTWAFQRGVPTTDLTVALP